MSTPRKVKVLIAYHHLPHYRYAVFSELQRAQKLEVHFAGGEPAPGSGILTIGKGTLANIHSLDNLWIGPFLYQRRLLGLIKAQEYDKVIFLGDWKYISTWMAALECRRAGTDVYFWTIGWHRPSGFVRSLVRKKFYSLADKLLLYGQTGVDLAVRAGMDQRKLFVVGNSSSSIPPARIDSEPAMADPLVNSHSRTGPYVLTVVRLNRVKRLDMLIEAVGSIDPDTRPSVVMVGDGPEGDALRHQAEGLGVHLELPGAIHDERELHSLYQHAFVSVVPEAAGLTVLQALKNGVQVITADDPHKQMPEYEAIVHGENGFLYPVGDIAALANFIEIARKRYVESPGDLANTCRDSLSNMWTPEGSAARILEAIDYDSA